MSRPLNIRGGGGGPSFVGSQREIVIFVHGGVGRGDGDVAEDLFEEGNAARNEPNVHVKFAANGAQVTDPKVFGLRVLNVDVSGVPFQRHAGFVEVRRGSEGVGQNGHVVNGLRGDARDFGGGIALDFAHRCVDTGVGDQDGGIKCP